ncbi:MAG: hemolysin family protein [Clostridia bacterium]|nr:hemolysin family protein [Clostridia bacterium]
MSGDAPVPLANTFPIGLFISIIVLIIFSGFFSATETAYSCSNKIRLRTLSLNGNSKAEKVLFLAEEKFDKLISSILIGNNIVNLTASALSVLFFERILKQNVNPTAIATVVITLAVLIFGEIFPKFIAKTFPEKIAMAFYPLVICFYYLFYPFNVFFGSIKWLLSKIFNIKQNDVVTEDEIMTVVEEAEEDGTLKKEETKLIRSVIEFDDLEVGDILVPRVNIVAIEKDTPMETIKSIFEKEGYSRLPVYSNSIDTIIGTIHEKDFFKEYLDGKKNIQDILQDAFYTTEHIKISKLLKQLQKAKTHIAIILDEYGGTLGLITLEDILEELVGEIWDEHDEVINYFKKISDSEFMVDGNAPLSEFFEYFEIKEDPENYETNTISGFAIKYLGEIPTAGTKFSHFNLNFEIVKSTVKRIQQIKIIKE